MIRVWQILFIAACLVIFYLVTCNGKSDPDNATKTITKIETRVDTIKGEVKYIKVPVPYETIVSEIIYDTIPCDEMDYVICPTLPPDTIGHYSDTLLIDTLGFVVVKDTIKGKLLGRSAPFQFYHPTTTITNTIVPRLKNKVFIGTEVVGNKINPFEYVGLNLSLQLKKSDSQLEVGTGLMNNSQYYKAGVKIKIKL